MRSNVLSRQEFWIGVFVLIALICSMLWFTGNKISAEQERVHNERISDKLNDLYVTVDELMIQLESHSSMYVEVEACLKRHRDQPKYCWRRDYSFDPQAEEKAWSNLRTRESALRPYLNDRNSVEVIRSIGEVKANHFRDLRSMLPPSHPEDAQKVSDRILRTEQQLKEKYSFLWKSTSDRLLKNLDGLPEVGFYLPSLGTLFSAGTRSPGFISLDSSVACLPDHLLPGSVTRHRIASMRPPSLERTYERPRSHRFLASILAPNPTSGTRNLASSWSAHA